MQSATANILIHRPMDEVFDYIDDPDAIVEWLPNMVEVGDVVGKGLGQEHSWTYQAGGLAVHGQSVVIHYVPNERRIVQSVGGIQCTWTFELEQTDGATLLQIDADYIIPVPVLGKRVEKAVSRRNEEELTLAIENIKRRCEAMAA